MSRAASKVNRSTVEPKAFTARSPAQRQGSRFEQLALAYLQAQGLSLVAQNCLFSKVGELDLVMLEKGRAWDTLVFIEVRKRAPSSFADAAASVTPNKQRKIIKAAKYFLQQHPQYTEYDCRFDVVAYEHAELPPEWIVAAFQTSW